MPKKPENQKLWTIRMPADLLDQLRKGAEAYALPPQTFAKLVMRSGLLHLKNSGDLLTTKEDAHMLEKHQRRLIVEQSKFDQLVNEVEKDGPLEATVLAQRAPLTTEQVKETVTVSEPEDPYKALLEFAALMNGSSEVKGELVNTTQATSALIDSVVDDVSEKELLADIGGDRSQPARSEEDDDISDEEIASLLNL